MPAFRKTDRSLAWLTLTGLALSVSAVADFKVNQVQARLSEQTLMLAGSLELVLPPKVEEALSKGIELSLIIHLRLNRERSLLWDKNVADWLLRRQIRYHALSNQYLVTDSDINPDFPESFLSLHQALKHLGSLELKLELPKTLEEGRYVTEVRVYLDIEALPAPLRPVAYTSLTWHLNSGWTTWPVTH